jgi:hypothetical protein
VPRARVRAGVWCCAVPGLSGAVPKALVCGALLCQKCRGCAKGFGVWYCAVPEVSGAVPKALVCGALLCLERQVLCQRLWCVMLCCARSIRCCAKGFGVWCFAVPGFSDAVPMVWVCGAVPGAPGAVPKVLVCGTVLCLERQVLCQRLWCVWCCAWSVTF